MFKDIFSNLLQENNINTSKLSKDINISEAVLSKWKNGKTKPSYDNIKKLSQYFKVSINYLFEIEETSSTKIENSNINGHGNIINIESRENISYLEMEILQEIKKLSKIEQIKLLENLSTKDEEEQ